MDEADSPVRATPRSLTARSVVASTLLGTDPPRLPVAFLVRTGELFGLAEGAVRTALSRMAAAGEVRTSGDGWYALDGAMVERQQRQHRSRAAATVDWSGRWRMAVVVAGARPPNERVLLRTEMGRLRMAELHDAVWLRPDNLDRQAPSSTSTVVDSQCAWFSADPDLGPSRTEAALAAQLWDLQSWELDAERYTAELLESLVRVERGDVTELAPGFVLSASVLRHFGHDPLLPAELLPEQWPGERLRAVYDRYESAYRELLSSWSATDHGGRQLP